MIALKGAVAAFNPTPSITRSGEVTIEQLDSPIADMKNMGGDSPGAITAALFLADFVGNVPWAHLDVCGPMCADADESWRSKGATGFGSRLLVDLALNFTPPASRT